MFLLGTTLIKISFALTLLRIVGLRMHRYALYAALFATVVTGATEFFIVLFTCKPISAFWTTILDPTSGKCVGLNVQIAGSYSHGAVSLFVDILLGTLIPIHLLSSLQMQFRVKLSAGFLLSLGSMYVSIS
jgi:hypothetical protein